MAARSSTAPLTTLPRCFFAISDKKTAVSSPIGTPIRTDANVPTTEDKIIYKIPYEGVFAVGAHFVPNNSSETPTF